MAASNQKNVSLVVIVLSLLVAGGLLFAAVRELSAEIEGDSVAASGEVAALHDAASTGNVAAIRRELDAGAEIDARFDGSEGWTRGMTPLMTAIFHRQGEAARLLLERGAEINAAAADGRTPLIYAAGWGNSDMVALLLDRGANIDARSREGWTALMLASGARGEADAVDILVARGADTSYRNKWGQTALHLAAVARDREKIERLLAGGADASIRDNDGRTPLSILAANDADADLLALVINASGNRAVVNAADNDGITPLMRAADRGDADKIIVLLNNGADVTTSDTDGRTALEWAAARDDDRGRRVADILASAQP